MGKWHKWATRIRASTLIGKWFERINYFIMIVHDSDQSFISPLKAPVLVEAVLGKYVVSVSCGSDWTSLLTGNPASDA